MGISEENASSELAQRGGRYFRDIHMNDDGCQLCCNGCDRHQRTWKSTQCRPCPTKKGIDEKEKLAKLTNNGKTCKIIGCEEDVYPG